MGLDAKLKNVFRIQTTDSSHKCKPQIQNDPIAPGHFNAEDKHALSAAPWKNSCRRCRLFKPKI